MPDPIIRFLTGQTLRFPNRCRLARTPGWTHVSTPDGRWLASFIDGVSRVVPSGYAEAIAEPLQAA